MNVTPRRATAWILIGVCLASALCFGSASGALALPPNPNGRECGDLHVYYGEDENAFIAAIASGNQKAIRAARARVYDDLRLARWLGCDWVA